MEIERTDKSAMDLYASTEHRKKKYYDARSGLSQGQYYR